MHSKVLNECISWSEFGGDLKRDPSGVEDTFLDMSYGHVGSPSAQSWK